MIPERPSPLFLNNEPLTAITAVDVVLSALFRVALFAAYLLGNRRIYLFTALRTHPNRWIGSFVIHVCAFVCFHLIPLVTLCRLITTLQRKMGHSFHGRLLPCDSDFKSMTGQEARFIPISLSKLIGEQFLAARNKKKWAYSSFCSQYHWKR